MGHITADDAKWLVSIAIFAVLVWSVAFLVYVQPGNPRGARQRKADRQAAWRAKGYGKQKRALSPLAFVAMVFPSLIVITWYALPPHVRRQALEGVNFGAATNNAIGIGREVRALVGARRSSAKKSSARVMPGARSRRRSDARHPRALGHLSHDGSRLPSRPPHGADLLACGD